MQEISYQVFDEKSGLPFEEFSDSFVRKAAEKQNKSCSEVFTVIKENIKRKGVYYIISEDKRIKVMVKNSLSGYKHPKFDTYEEAFDYLNVEIINVCETYVKDDNIFILFRKYMDSINYYQDIDLIEAENKQTFYILIETANRIDDMIDNGEISISEVKDLRFLQSLIFNLEDNGVEHHFFVTPK